MAIKLEPLKVLYRGPRDRRYGPAYDFIENTFRIMIYFS